MSIEDKSTRGLPSQNSQLLCRIIYLASLAGTTSGYKAGSSITPSLERGHLGQKLTDDPPATLYVTWNIESSYKVRDVVLPFLWPARRPCVTMPTTLHEDGLMALAYYECICPGATGQGNNNKEKHSQEADVICILSVDPSMLSVFGAKSYS